MVNFDSNRHEFDKKSMIVTKYIPSVGFTYGFNYVFTFIYLTKHFSIFNTNSISKKTSLSKTGKVTNKTKYLI